MKSFLTTLLIILFLSNFSYSQTSRTGSFVANNPSIYPISGDATWTNNAGVITVDFLSNFSTIQGITLEVFLAKTKTLNLSTDLKISLTPIDQGTSMGTQINGPYTFNVPAGTNLFEYDNILVQCTSASVLWGHANLCASNLILGNTPLPSDTYRGELTINSSSIIPNATSTNFEAQNSIVLDQGFEAQMISGFQADAGPGLGCIIE